MMAFRSLMGKEGGSAFNFYEKALVSVLYKNIYTYVRL